ncbi:mandelate dehydrogenase [Marinobacterium iners]|uniref:alpha-hydroxy-acid oxidizing protein n=1 Tax=Marinobacterium iners TaxID=48076 RepID=UPI001A8E02CF|nr:alpha-hydroxy-acid oxidizing protein [Marinobacterium iners]QSR35322.1 mandelate dehydrogenase [Marinobacterium iners]
MKMISHNDYRRAAKSKLPKMVFDYLEGGADNEVGLQHNLSEIEKIKFAPKRLLDVGSRNISRTILGKSQQAPFAVAPTGLNGMFSSNGDVKIARAAAKAGIPFSLSTASNASIEEVAKACDGELWFQLYVIHRELAKQFVERAKNSGYQVLILTVDVGVNGYRERDLRNGFSLPAKYTPRTILDGALHPAWSLNLLKNGMPKLANFETAELNDIEVQAALMSRKMDASFNWEDLRWLRDQWPHRLVVKGINSVEDVKRCAEMGIDGVVLSNHGGRQLDSCIAPIQILERAASSVDISVMIDSGIRRGSDIVKAVALGAEATLIGRPLLWALAARGEEGVGEMIQMLKDDVDRTLAHIGCADINQLDKSFIYS